MPEPRTERDLLAALAAGDREAAEALVDRTYPVVFRVMCQMCHGDAARAADLTQETYRRAWSALRRFEGRSSFSTWLCRIAYNAFLDEVRRNHDVAADPAVRGAEFADGTGGQVEGLIRGETERALRRAVLALPDDLRFLVVARFWAEVPVSELARLEGVSEVAIRKRLRRALAAIADALPGGAGRLRDVTDAGREPAKEDGP